MKHDNNIENVFKMLDRGSEYINKYHDLHNACECYETARIYLKNIYGENSKWSHIINLYDYVWDEHQGNYHKAALRLADAGELIDSFDENDVTDEFTAWISENKEGLMNAAVESTLNVLHYIDWNYSLEDIMIQFVLSENNPKEVINRTFIDARGLPRRFDYLVKRMIGNMKVDLNMITPVIQMYSKMQNLDPNIMSYEEKIDFVQKMREMLDASCSIWKDDSNKGISSYMESHKNSFNYDVVRGLLSMEDVELADFIFEGMEKEDNYADVESKIQIKLLECLLEYKKGNRNEAEQILTDIMELENNIIMHAFFVKDEREKIELFREIEHLMGRTAELCNQIQGVQKAYSLLVRTRTLSFDHPNINLNGREHKHAILEILQLKKREKAIENIYSEQRKLEDYFNKISCGIFEFDSREICRKLTDKQAVLEFSIMRDERDYDYYYVFIVTGQKISAINLGERKEIDQWIAGISDYIKGYVDNKYSKNQIRMNPDYYVLYQKVLQPIGEILPQKIHKLFIAGAGGFLQLPFGLLPCFHWYDKFMEDEYQIIYINSGKELLNDVDRVVDPGAVVIGNPDFDGIFPELPSSEREAAAVGELLHVTPMTGIEAIPECLKKRAGIYHISTHSYEKTKEELGSDLDPMKKANLVFAGGRMLSAKEISQLDMSKTDLVVLSVCGMKEGKGVYNDLGPGIRRAFINAGARHIILNLWETDDNAAEILMKCFYDLYIKKKKKIEEALRSAKRYLRTTSVGSIKRGSYYVKNLESIFALMKEEEIPYAHPYYWAGFILIGV